MIRRNKPTRVQLGYHKQEERIKRKLGRSVEVRHHVRILWINGTFDRLARPKLTTRLASKSHPTDIGYFKRVLLLNDRGRDKLIQLKAKQNSRR